MMKASVLVADIGGTNCRFQMWELDGSLEPTNLTLESYLPTADYPEFDDAMAAFLASCTDQETPAAAAFACAGPVKDQRCEFTNLGWVVDSTEVTTRFNMTNIVLNDFEAVGYGVPALPASSILTLHPGKPQAQGPIVVLGPGTGLGEAQLFWDIHSNNYIVHPSEGSHATFAPRGPTQRALQAHIEKALKACEVEHVASGSGLVRIYNFLRKEQGLEVKLNISPAQVSGRVGSDAVAQQALDMLLAIVGAEAGHMALRSLATGGVYICGGIFPRILDRVKSTGIVEDAFLWKESRFYDKFLKNTPLYVVTDESLGLLGAREQAARLVKLKYASSSEE